MSQKYAKKVPLAGSERRVAPGARDSGAIDGGDAAVQQTDLCEPPFACTQFSGSWRCCLVGAGGADLCRVPDGGN